MFDNLTHCAALPLFPLPFPSFPIRLAQPSLFSRSTSVRGRSTNAFYFVPLFVCFYFICVFISLSRTLTFARTNTRTRTHTRTHKTKALSEIVISDYHNFSYQFSVNDCASFTRFSTYARAISKLSSKSIKNLFFRLFFLHYHLASHFKRSLCLLLSFVAIWFLLFYGRLTSCLAAHTDNGMFPVNLCLSKALIS